jgi:hypothetical protein
MKASSDGAPLEQFQQKCAAVFAGIAETRSRAFPRFREKRKRSGQDFPAL